MNCPKRLDKYMNFTLNRYNRWEVSNLDDIIWTAQFASVPITMFLIPTITIILSSLGLYQISLTILFGSPLWIVIVPVIVRLFCKIYFSFPNKDEYE